MGAGSCGCECADSRATRLPSRLLSLSLTLPRVWVGEGAELAPSVPVPLPTGSSGAQGSSGGGSSAHYAVNSQFTMGGPAISMASPMSIPTNTMHYGS